MVKFNDQLLKIRNTKYGRHIVADLYSDNNLNNIDYIKNLLEDSARLVNATILHTHMHKFEPHGVTGVVLLAESHISIHTWPEDNFISIDIFMCGDCDPEKALYYIVEQLNATIINIKLLTRGNIGYFNENILLDTYQQRFKVKEWLVDDKSEFQKIDILDTEFHGKALILDGTVQTTELDEFCYHEMIAHVPIFACSHLPKNVLVIGGADGGVVREVIKHKSIQQVSLVDIDGKVKDLCMQYLPQISNGALNDDRVTVKIEDGIKYIKQYSRSDLDIIIVDSTDPVDCAVPLFTKDFYQSCYNSLVTNGLLCVQSGLPIYYTDNSIYDNNQLSNITAHLRSIFKYVTHYVAVIPTYVGGYMVFTLASDDNNIDKLSISELEEKFNVSGIQDLKSYNVKLHYSAFMLPNYIIKATGK